MDGKTRVQSSTFSNMYVVSSGGGEYVCTQRKSFLRHMHPTQIFLQIKKLSEPSKHESLRRYVENNATSVCLCSICASLFRRALHQYTVHTQVNIGWSKRSPTGWTPKCCEDFLVLCQTSGQKQRWNKNTMVYGNLDITGGDSHGRTLCQGSRADIALQRHVTRELATTIR